jgi:hypothetical protein
VTAGGQRCPRELSSAFEEEELCRRRHNSSSVVRPVMLPSLPGQLCFSRQCESMAESHHIIRSGCGSRAGAG